MNDLAASAIAFAITVALLWLVTRKDERVSNQWVRPNGVLVRTAILVIAFHAVFVALGIPALNGYLIVVLFVALSITGIFLDPFAMLFGVTAWLFYEWIFWFPSKDQIIHSHSLKEQSKRKPLLDARRGFAASDLNPIGRVEIEGMEYEARSSLGFIEKGDLVEVEKTDGFELQVRKIEG